MDVKILNYETVTNPSAWCEIDLKALAHNFQELQKLASKNMSHTLGIMPVIKADASAFGNGLHKNNAGLHRHHRFDMNLLL